MTLHITLGLLQNAGLLLGIAVVFDLATSGTSPSWSTRRKVLAGLAAGSIGAVMVLTATTLQPGVIFDTRSVLLSVTALFLGPVPAIIAMTTTAAARVTVGGAGTLVGLSVILASGAIGLIWRRAMARRDLADISTANIYGMGLTVHLVMLGLILFIPGVGSFAIRQTWIPVLLVHPLATVALGSLLRFRLQRQRSEDSTREAREVLRDQEARVQLAMSSTKQAFFDLDVRTCVETLSANYAAMLGMPMNDTVVETRSEWLQRLHPDDRERALAAAEDYLAGRTNDYRVETRRKCLDGSYIWTLAQGSIVERDDEGRPLRMSGTVQDITALKEAELHAQEAEELAQSTLDALRENICVLDADGNILAVNEAWRRFADENGALGGSTFVGENYLEVCRASDDPTAVVFARGLLGVLEGKQQSFEMEYPCHAPNEQRWFMARVSRISGSAVAEAVVAHENISARMLAEMNLRKVLRAVEQSPISIVITDTDANIEYVNPRFVQTTGYDREELTGQNPRILKSGLTPPERYRDLWDTVTRGKTWKGIFVNRKKTGEIYYDEATIAPIRGVRDEIVGYVGAKVDITEKLAAEEERARLMRVLEASQSNAKVGSWEIEIKEQTLFMTAESKRLFGFDPESEPSVEDVFARMTEESAREARATLEYAMGTGETPGLEVRTKDGRTLHFSATATMAGTRPTRLTGSIQDITERTAAEADRLELTKQLAFAQRLESLGRLAGGVAHDLNNVLAAINNVASARKEAGGTGKETTDAFDTIARACERGRSVVSSLLYFARESVQQKGPIDLNDVVREVGELLEHTMLKRAHLETDLQKPLPTIEGDAHAVEQALVNLCLNALDAMEGSGGRITIQTRSKDDGLVEVSVTDTGSGMSPEVARRAIEPFFTTKPAGQGTGLGLAMVYGTVSAHGGTLDLSSEPGKGTRVSMTFPVASQATTTYAARSTDSAGGARPLSVLLIDDDDLILETFTPLLEGLGHEVTARSSGPAALETLNAGFEPDLVILDMNMPGMSGADVLPLILELRPAQPVLICTGYSDENLAALEQAGDNVSSIRKPFTVAELQRAIASIV